MVTKKRFFLLGAGLGLLALTLATPAEELLLVKAEKIYTAAAAGVIENGAILIRNGKIVQAGQNMPVPAGARILTAKVVTPGLIDIHTHLGVYSVPTIDENSDGNEMTNPVTPQVRALDSFNFEDPAIPVARSGGVTTVVALPGSGNVIGGSGVAVKLKSGPVETMIFKEICTLKMAIEGNPVGVYGPRKRMPSTLMAVYHLARKAFIDAQEYQKGWRKYEQEKKGGKPATPPKRDLGKEVLVMALNRQIPVHIHCATAAEIMSSIRLAREFNLRLSLGHCYWAYLITDDLKAHRDVHFNVGPPMFFSYFDNPLFFKNNPAILASAGLRVSLQTDAVGGGQQNLLHLAQLCVRYGMTRQDALKAITLNEAEAAGLDDRIGSIVAGKDADLVLFDGDPFQLTSSVEKVIIDGRVEYQKETAPVRPLGPVARLNSRPLDIPATAAESRFFAIRCGTILTMAGEPLVDGVILVRDGKIEKIGVGLSVPAGWPVIDARGQVVLPGLVSARSFTGISANWRRQSSIDEIGEPLLPELEVKHALEPQAPLFPLVRQLGITTILVTPGNRNVIGGQGLAVKTRGSVVDKMIVKDRAVMVFGLGASAKREGEMPTTRMGIMALLREKLIKAREYRDKLERTGKTGKDDKPERDLSLEALLPVLKGEMPVLVHCERKDDILSALRIGDEFSLKIILDGASDAYKVTAEISRRNIPVILEDLFRGIGQVEDQGFNPENGALLTRAGITVAFRAAEGSWYTPGAGEPGGDLLTLAALQYKQGMSEQDALRAVTINPARIIGLDKRIGSLEAGKDADILILNGQPLLTETLPQAVIIDGRLVYQRRPADNL